MSESSGGKDTTSSLDGSTILLTGGTGSFGRAFLQHVIGSIDATVRVFSRDEYKQSELRSQFGDERVRYLIGDVRDRYRLTRAAQGAQVIVHAAALKQVPVCEYNPFEAVQTNVIGAQHVVEAAIDAGVGRVLALSTDKAVNPVNLYGASKLCAEKIMIQGNAYAAISNTRISCVRYGNVFGSRGSILPLFIEQRKDGRLTITDERMTRFLITLEEAVKLVLFALDNMQGGEVFVPKVPSTRTIDIAEAVAPDVPRVTVGMRPGEKLHEVLITSDETRHTVDAGSVYVILPEHPWWTREKHWTHGAALPDGFQYSSDKNEHWLDVDELRKLLA